jgi:phosphoribosylformylglycinamidine synthase I
VMQAVQRHAADGGPVLGICNGFQILCESHLLPGALMRNAGLSFVSKPVDLIVERTDTPFTAGFAQGARIRLPVAHGEGRYVAADATLRELEAEGRVVLRYVPETEGSPLQPNPNGSARHIAGVSNAAGNVVGIMPHPERAGDPATPDEGAEFFMSMAARQPQASTIKATSR